ncbi:Lrp/AsnC family transcriptional regulator [Candidatus Bathyarchaeota archaeon]|nr:Lrp/AsnC family transcriptional regulator [Candidatus Bathyarchaeota archaeon]
MVDQTDLKILSLLEADSSTPFTEIARMLGLSESTVRKRVASMKEEGVIRKFTIILEPSRVGYNTVAIVGIDVEPSKLLEAAQRLAEIPETRYVATSTGDHMIMTEIWARDGRELSRIISEKIGGIDGIRRICPSIVLERFKY